MPGNDCYKIFTIGVYGFTEEVFFQTLISEGIEILCDIRRRRGMRGSKYRFANAKYLENRLKELGIRYHHAINLSPDDELRSKQKEVDKTAGIAKRERGQLARSFIEGFEQRYLKDFNAERFLSEFLAQKTSICFLCVEENPSACHRSLVAEAIQKQLSVSCKDLLP